MESGVQYSSTSSKFAWAFHLSAGNKNDAPEGRKLIKTICPGDKHVMIADRTYKDERLRKTMKEQGFIPVVSPKKNCKKSWEYDKKLYKRRNESVIESCFCRQV